MMKKLIPVLFAIRSEAQSLPDLLSAVPFQLSSYSTDKNAFSFLGNTAALSRIRHFSAGIAGERKFMLPELSTYTAAICLSTPSGNFGWMASRYGGQTYSATTMGLAYARSMGKLDLGAQFNYVSDKISSYKTVSFFDFSLGCLFKMTEGLQMGIQISNPVTKNKDPYLREKPFTCSLGLGWTISDMVSIGTLLEKTEDQSPDLKTGISYRLDKKLETHLGLSIDGGSFYVGAGYVLAGMEMNVTLVFHQRLGMTPGLAVLYQPMKK
jgi:hypothetical protein